MQAVLAEIDALREDAERRLVRARSGQARDEILQYLARITALQDRIKAEGQLMTAETARALLREIMAR